MSHWKGTPAAILFGAAAGSRELTLLGEAGGLHGRALTVESWGFADPGARLSLELRQGEAAVPGSEIVSSGRGVSFVTIDGYLFK